jgi:hypothetical protein
MPSHHVKLFVVDGEIYYIHHNVSSPSDDDPGKHTRAPSGDKARFVARDDGGFSIEFKAESPFVSGAGSPGSPIVSVDGSPTTLETLKTISTVRKRFPYTTTLAQLQDDPEIIIDNSGGTGGKPKKATKKKKK